MDERALQMALEQQGTVGERTPDCPDEYVLAAAVDGSLPAEVREAWVGHFSDCAWCLKTLADLRRIHDKGVVEPVPDIAAARARRLVRRNRVRYQAPRWAAAAILVLALGITLDRHFQSPPEPAFHSQRSIDRDALQPRILQPAAGDTLSLRHPEFAWTPVKGSLYYDIRLVTADGELVSEERVSGTKWDLPKAVSLQPDTQYFVRVDAYLAEGKRVSSRHVPFMTRGQP